MSDKHELATILHLEAFEVRLLELFNHKINHLMSAISNFDAAVTPALKSIANDVAAIAAAGVGGISPADQASLTRIQNTIVGIQAQLDALAGTVVSPVLIILDQTSVSVATGSPVNVNATVTGGTPQYDYQWSKDGTALPAQVSSVLSIPSATTADSGSYTVAVTDSTGATATSAAVSVSVA